MSCVDHGCPNLGASRVESGKSGSSEGISLSADLDRGKASVGSIDSKASYWLASPLGSTAENS